MAGTALDSRAKEVMIWMVSFLEDLSFVRSRDCLLDELREKLPHLEPALHDLADRSRSEAYEELLRVASASKGEYEQLRSDSNRHDGCPSNGEGSENAEDNGEPQDLQPLEDDDDGGQHLGNELLEGDEDDDFDNGDRVPASSRDRDQSGDGELVLSREPDTHSCETERRGVALESVSGNFGSFSTNNEIINSSTAPSTLKEQGKAATNTEIQSGSNNMPNSSSEKGLERSAAEKSRWSQVETSHRRARSSERRTDVHVDSKRNHPQVERKWVEYSTDAFEQSSRGEADRRQTDTVDHTRRGDGGARIRHGDMRVEAQRRVEGIRRGGDAFEQQRPRGDVFEPTRRGDHRVAGGPIVAPMAAYLPQDRPDHRRHRGSENVAGVRPQGFSKSGHQQVIAAQANERLLERGYRDGVRDSGRDREVPDTGVHMANRFEQGRGADASRALVQHAAVKPPGALVPAADVLSGRVGSDAPAMVDGRARERLPLPFGSRAVPPRAAGEDIVRDNQLPQRARQNEVPLRDPHMSKAREADGHWNRGANFNANEIYATGGGRDRLSSTPSGSDPARAFIPTSPGKRENSCNVLSTKSPPRQGSATYNDVIPRERRPIEAAGRASDLTAVGLSFAVPSLQNGGATGAVSGGHSDRNRDDQTKGRWVKSQALQSPVSRPVSMPHQPPAVPQFPMQPYDVDYRDTYHADAGAPMSHRADSGNHAMRPNVHKRKLGDEQSNSSARALPGNGDIGPNYNVSLHGMNNALPRHQGPVVSRDSVYGGKRMRTMPESSEERLYSADAVASLPPNGMNSKEYATWNGPGRGQGSQQEAGSRGGKRRGM